MKTITRIISLFMVALILTTSVPFTPVSAVDVGTENYTLNMEKTYADSSLAESSAVGGMSFFGRTEFDGCYGNQLLGVAREIYDSLVENYTTEKITGEYTYAFETPFTFDAEISGSSIVMNDELEEIDIEIGYAVQAAMDAFLYDHPEVFWLRIIGASYGVSASGNDVRGYTGIIDDITIIPTEIYSGASSKLSQYESAVDSVIDAITVIESRYDTLKNIHDYICNNAWYNLVSEQRVHSSEPFFIGDGGVVCEGYAKTFKIICDRLDIPCVLVSGNAGGAHMWNYVQMDDGKWYLVDATWDDQESKIYDTYFLADANTIGFDDVAINEERIERSDFSGMGIFSFTYPVLSATAYTVHIHEWDSDYTVDVEPTCTEKGSKSIHCKSCDETKSVTEIPATDTHSYENYICSCCGEYDVQNLVDYGKCGESVYYTLDKEGNMRIFGEGEMYDYQCYYDEFYRIEYTTAPWDAKPLQSSNRSLIKNVEIENITSIGDYAFYKCGSLTSIKISDSVRKINGWSFGYCQNLESVIIPNSIVNIAAYAFANCIKLRNITIPSSVTYIGSYAFYGCSDLEGIVVNKENNYYSNDDLGALYDKNKSVLYMIPQKIKSEVYIIPDGVKKIDTYAFSYGTDINSIVIPSSVQYISDRAFDWDGECFDMVHYLGTSDDWNRMEKGKNNYYLTSSSCHYCSEKEKSNATCVNNGNESGWYCVDCEEYVLGGELITKLGHSFSDEYTIDKEPTCTTKGSKSQHCDREGCTRQINITSIPATNHLNKTECIQQDSTCSEVGYTAGVYCNDCREWIEGHDEIPSKGHSWLNATCIDKKTCSICGATTGFALGHSLTSHIIRKATCTTDGEITYSCSKCQYSYTENISRTGHRNTTVFYYKYPTCTEDGYTDGEYCNDCNSWIKGHSVLSATGHKSSVGVIIKRPSCIETGIREYRCLVCETITSTEVISANGHSYIYHSEKTPTCTNFGWQEYETCGRCNYTTYNEIPATGHSDKNKDDFCEVCHEYLKECSSKLIEKGDCGTSAEYKFYEDGTLLISGTGKIETMHTFDLLPWYSYNKDIKKVIIENGITEIADYSFLHCYYLTDIIIPESIEIIRSFAFQYCTSLKQIALPESIVGIGEGAFNGCESLEDIVLPDNLKYIHSGTFFSCDNLKSVSMSKNIRSIGKNAFGQCNNLTDIYYTGSQKEWSEVFVDEYNEKLDGITVHFRWGHSDVPKTIKESSCFETGLIRYTCTICYDYYDKETEKLPHTPDSAVTENRVEPKCEVKGSYDEVVYCSVCDTEISRTEKEIPALSHNWNDGVINPVSTCKTHGTKTYTCQNDASHKKTEQIPLDSSNHKGGTYLKDKAVATCTVNGYTGDTYCSGCNVKLSTGEIIPATNHLNAEFVEQVDATCTSMGYTVGTYCPDCKEWLEGHEEIPKLPHDYDSVVIVPTCTAKGYTTHTCTVCGESYTDTYVNAKGHKGGIATCKNKAECTVCGEEYGSINADNHKSLVTLKAVTSTCSKTGLTEGSHCSVCKAVIKKQNVVAKKAHTYKTTVTKATLSKNGKTETKCTVCGYISKITVIYAPKTVKLSTTTYTYNGKAKTPPVTVKDSKGKKLKNGTDYTVKYSKGRKSIGKYTVTVTFKGNYSGTKKITFEIVPAKVTLSKLTVGSKALTATWKTVSGATGYEVQYSTSKKFTSKTTRTVKIKSSKTKKTTIKKLTKGKKYYVRIRAYKTVSKKPVYGAWSSVKNIKVK